MTDSLTERLFDKLEIRCPKLGHEIPFSYCRHEGGSMPCFRILSCWHSRIPVEEELQAIMDAEQWDQFLSQRPPDKLSTILDVIELAIRRKKNLKRGNL